jgi:hypothetical protein
MKADLFEPKDANPTYTEETQYKKIHEWFIFKFYTRHYSGIDW